MDVLIDGVHSCLYWNFLEWTLNESNFMPEYGEDESVVSVKVTGSNGVLWTGWEMWAQIPRRLPNTYSELGGTLTLFFQIKIHPPPA